MQNADQPRRILLRLNGDEVWRTGVVTHSERIEIEPDPDYPDGETVKAWQLAEWREVAHRSA